MSVRAALVVAAAVCMMTSAASAALLGQNYVTVTAENSIGSGSWALAIPNGWHFPASGTWTYVLPAPVDISTTSGTPVASLNALTISFQQDPAVDLAFSATAPNATTHFTFTAAPVSFPAMTNPFGYASSATTLTDSNNNGATATGTFPGSKMYRATYNGSTDWAYLNGPMTANGNSNVSNERQPAVSMVVIPGSVSQLSSQFDFNLSALDQASGTSHFEVTPEPASLSMLGIAGLFVRRRRR